MMLIRVTDVNVIVFCTVAHGMKTGFAVIAKHGAIGLVKGALAKVRAKGSVR